MSNYRRLILFCAAVALLPACQSRNNNGASVKPPAPAAPTAPAPSARAAASNIAVAHVSKQANGSYLITCSDTSTEVRATDNDKEACAASLTVVANKDTSMFLAGDLLSEKSICKIAKGTVLHIERYVVSRSAVTPFATLDEQPIYDVQLVANEVFPGFEKCYEKRTDLLAADFDFGAGFTPIFSSDLSKNPSAEGRPMGAFALPATPISAGSVVKALKPLPAEGGATIGSAPRAIVPPATEVPGNVPKFSDWYGYPSRDPQ